MTSITDTTLYLASASPRRHEILNQLLIPHYVLHVPPQAGDDEPQFHGEPADQYVRRTARDKLTHAAKFLAQTNSLSEQRNPNFLEATTPPRRLSDDVVILCADTAVILDGLVLGKPQGREDVERTLNELSGRTHQVHTALAAQRAGTLYESVSVSHVQFKQLTTAEIDAYCHTADGMGKAGAYGIQGPAAAFVKHLSGSYTGVMGLPAYETVELLSSAHYLRQRP